MQTKIKANEKIKFKLLTLEMNLNVQLGKWAHHSLDRELAPGIDVGLNFRDCCEDK